MKSLQITVIHRNSIGTAVIALLLVAAPTSAAVQDDVQPQADTSISVEEAPSLQIVISDDPTAIDPVSVVQPELAQPVTVEFQATSLRDVIQWLQTDRQLSVSLDTAALNRANILLSEPVTESLSDEPLYLLLDRLRTLDLSWHPSDGMINITTIEQSNRSSHTVPYHLGDLLDAGYSSQRIEETVDEVINNAVWMDDSPKNSDEFSSIVLLGDVLFVRNNQAMHRQVAGLLEAMRSHSRRTMVLDPPQHTLLRQRLDGRITVNLRDVPLDTALSEIAELSGTDIRLHRANVVADHGIRERAPVSLEITDQKFSVALRALLSQLKLTWIIRDGVIWVVHQDGAETFARLAVYDVRDLCQNDDEAEALGNAIISQSSGPWEFNEGEGGAVSFPQPGVLVVRHTEQGHYDVLQLLENYRLALRSSRQRVQEGPDPNELFTHYYRLPAEIAADMQQHLPQLIQPNSWKSAERPDGNGSILKLSSGMQLVDGNGFSIIHREMNNKNVVRSAVLVDHSVLVIHQTRATHQEISRLLSRVQMGDPPVDADGDRQKAGGGMGGMGGGMGSGMGGGMGGMGFGGGFFRIPPE